MKKVREDSLQFFLQGILSSHFQAYREVPRGDGIIDFFIIGPEGINIVIETKMSDDENYLDGIKNQLPTYLRRIHSNIGFFILFYINGSKTYIDNIKDELRRVRMQLYNDFNIVDVVIDLRERPSPSKQISNSDLRNIKGIGPKKAEILVAAGYDSIKKIKEASIDELFENTRFSKNFLISIKNKCEILSKKSK